MANSNVFFLGVMEFISVAEAACELNNTGSKESVLICKIIQIVRL